MDSDSCFGRILDWTRGGFMSIAPRGYEWTATRRYLDETLVLQTTFTTNEGSLRVYDFFAMRPGGRELPHRQLLRIIEGIEGEVAVRVEISPRFDFGELRPWIRRAGSNAFAAVGSDDGLYVWANVALERSGPHDIRGDFSISGGQRLHVSMQFAQPAALDKESTDLPDPGECDKRLEQTIDWWRTWSTKVNIHGGLRPSVVRSAITLKAMTYAPTGAIIAAPTTSLPEAPGGERNWDYRFTWIRDSVFTVRSLAQVGCTAEADGFRRFVERSAAGSAEDLQILYRLDGSRRTHEIVLETLEGYRGAAPVRVGNAAADQTQLDVYGELLEFAWRWHERGHSPDDDYWDFLVELVDVAASRWRDPDRGIWEVRGKPQHFVHSKVMCWTTFDRGILFARAAGRNAPVDRWKKERDEIRKAIESDGYDSDRGIFLRAFGSREVDAALLLLPRVGFIDYDDERMMRTTDAVRADLEEDGLIARYRTHDGLTGVEGTFLACTFFLATCLARQGRVEAAHEVFQRAAGTANDLGLFAEEHHVKTNEMAGNFPQALTHLAYIDALLALEGQ
jgi:GH15 family glucan-1,4-alpha-glucosidase